MTASDKWLIGTAVVGSAAGSLATVILWMLLTRPIELAARVSGLL
jgi:hypothetical protein